MTTRSKGKKPKPREQRNMIAFNAMLNGKTTSRPMRDRRKRRLKAKDTKELRDLKLDNELDIR